MTKYPNRGESVPRIRFGPGELEHFCDLHWQDHDFWDYDTSDIEPEDIEREVRALEQKEKQRIEKEHCADCQVQLWDYHIYGCPAEICPMCCDRCGNCNCYYHGLPWIPFFARAGEADFGLYTQLRKTWTPGSYEPVIDLSALQIKL